jgi:hypothetical protein
MHTRVSMLQSRRLRLPQPVERTLGRGLEDENWYTLVDYFRTEH